MTIKPILDSDALIKLSRADILDDVLNHYACVIPSAVYQEAVVFGRRRGFVDVEEIENVNLTTFDPMLHTDREIQELQARFGLGESEVLFLFDEGMGDVVVSDDRHFLTEVSGRGIPHLEPPLLVAAMVWDGTITQDRAHNALDRMRPYIRLSTHDRTLEILEP